MKIAYLANVRIPSERAHSTQIVHMCQAFAEMGNSLTLFANTRVNGGSDDFVKQYHVNPKFDFYRVRHGFLRPGWKWTFYLSELIFSLSVLPRLRKSDFDIVYSRNEWTVWFLSFFLQIDMLVWESHEAKKNLPAKRLLKKGIRLVAISDGVADEYKKYDNLVIVAHDGVDESFFNAVESKEDARKRLGIKTAKPVVMYIGGLEKWKGVDTFFVAARLLKGVAQFVVIGGTVEVVSRLQKQFPMIQFLGPQPYFDLPHNQQAADVLVIPNTAKEPLSATYTSPLKLFAHMSSGIPLVVSDVPSLTMITGAHAPVFCPDDPHSLSATITSVLSDAGAYKRNVEELQKKAVEYRWTKRAKRITNFLTNSSQ